jgi:CspA family cold shock protein
MTERIGGFVVWYDPTRDYGFVKCTDDVDVFLHGCALRQAGLRALKPGDELTFTIERGKSGKPQARDLRLMN